MTAATTPVQTGSKKKKNAQAPPAMACKCCRHQPPHCRCKVDRVYTPPQPVKTKPKAGDIVRWLNLAQIAYAIWRVTKIPTTTLMVSGAIRALGLGIDKTPRAARIKGCVLFRQQTMVHPSQLPNIQARIQEQYHAI